jgi:hypothetical protein
LAGFREAARSLARHWPVVVGALADALVEERHLTGDAVRSIVAAAPTGMRLLLSKEVLYSRDGLTGSARRAALTERNETF